MPKYIEVDMLADMIEAKANTLVEGKEAFLYMCKWLDYLPAADVAEVKHGTWVEKGGKMWCSLCHATNKKYKPPYCSYCGAKMDGKETGTDAT